MSTNISSYGQDPSFIWVVDPPRNISDVIGGGDGNVPNATYELMPLGMPGDMTIFIFLPPPDYEYDREKVGVPYWTSPMYIVGNDPLPAPGTATGAAGRKTR